MNNNKLMIAIFAFICLVLIYRKYNSTRIDPILNQQVTRPSSGTGSNTNNAFPSAADVQKQRQATQPESTPLPVADIKSAFTELDKKSNETVSEFKSLVQLQLLLPPEFRFTKIDMSIDNVEGIYGVTGDRLQGLAILASNLPADLATVRKYLDEVSTDIPNLKGKRVKWGTQTQSFPATPRSGLGGTTVWQGGNGSQEIFAAAYMERADRKGRYIFIFSSKKPNAIHNDGYFEGLLSQVKAE